jgi:hypothetical protein
MKIGLREIIEFLEDKKGYRKEGKTRLKNILSKKGYDVSDEDCAEALAIANKTDVVKKQTQDFKEVVEEYLEYTAPHFGTTSTKQTDKVNLKLRSKWQSASGEWLESYRAVPESEVPLSLEDIEGAVKNALKSVAPSVTPLVAPSIFHRKSMLVWTSDKHIGADTTDAQHDKPYNKEVFAERMYSVADKIVTKSFEEGKFHTVVIADLGDATDGQDGYTASRTHRLPQNMTNREVFETYMEVHIKFLETLVKNAVAYNYEFWFNTCSNHGGSYEYACHKAFQIYIQTKYPKIKVNSFDKFLGHTEFQGVTYLLTHGKDDKNRKFGLPLYPDAKTEVFIDNYLKLNRLSFNNNIRLIKGDLHQSASVPCKNINRYRNVASIFGSSGWVMDNYGYTPAGCDYEILDGNEITEGTFWFD